MSEQLEPSVDFNYDEVDRGNPLAAVISEADENAFRIAAIESRDFYMKIFMAIQDYRGDKAFAFDCACFALGWLDLARAKTQDDIAKRHKCERANVNRLIVKIQSRVKIPPTVGQRAEDVRNKFSQIRKGQLKKI